MANDELPKLSNTMLCSSNYSTADWTYRPEEEYSPLTRAERQKLCGGASALASPCLDFSGRDMNAAIVAYALHDNFIKEKEIKVMPTPSARLVRVLVVDTDKRIPLEDRILFRGAEQLTDLTDQELFYEIEIVNLLKVHNNKRSQIPIKGKEKEYLDPVRIKDLSMVVTVIASF